MRPDIQRASACGAGPRPAAGSQPACSVVRLAAIAFLAATFVQSQTPNDAARELTPNTAATGRLEPGKIDRYIFRAEQQQVIRFTVNAGGGRPGVRVFWPRNGRLGAAIGVVYRSRHRVFLWRAASAGIFRIEISASELAENAITYDLTLDPPHDATPQELTRFRGDESYNAALTARSARQFDEAMRRCQEALALYQEAADRAAEEEALREIGLIHESRREYQQELGINQKLLAMFQEDDEPWGVGTAQNAIGFAFQQLRQYDNALKSYRAAMEARRACGDLFGQAQTSGNMGAVYRNAGRPDDARAAFQDALTLYRRLKDDSRQAFIGIDLALVYETDGRFEEELTVLEDAFAAARRAKDRRAEVNVVFRKGRAESNLNRFAAQISDLLQALPLSRELNDEGLTGAILHDIGWAHFRQDESEKARPYLEQALAARRNAKDDRGTIQTLITLARVHLNMRDQAGAATALDEALRKATEINFGTGKAYALQVSGYLADARHQPERALSYYRAAVTTAADAGDQRQEGYGRWDLGTGLIWLDRAEEATGELERSVQIFRDLHLPSDQARVLGTLGRAYHVLNQLDRSRKAFDDALSLIRGLKDRRGEASLLRSIGSEYRVVNEYDKALNAYTESLAILVQLGDVRSQAQTLNSMGLIYGELSRSRALECFTQALTLLRSTGSTLTEAAVLHNIAVLDSLGGDPRKAIPYFEEAIEKHRGLTSGDPPAVLFVNFSRTWLAANNPAKARETAERALAISLERRDRSRQWEALVALANALDAAGSPDAALSRMEEALATARKGPNAAEAASVWKEMGKLRQRRGDYQRAAQCYENALAGYRLAKRPKPEADVLGSLSSMWTAAGQKFLAVAYGKQAVNVVQNIRATVESLEPDLQQGFVSSNEKLYRDLAGLLISMQRLPEAREVLDLLKHEEYREFVGRGEAQPSASSRQLSLTPEEREFTDRYAQIAGRLVALGRRRSDLFAKLERTPDEERELTRLDADLEAGNAAFHQKLDEIAASFAAKPEAAMRMNQLRESQAFKDDLAELQHGAVVIYTVVTADRYRAILVTPSVQKAYEFAISSADLAKKVFDFREALQNPNSDPVPPARELYRIMVGPQLAEDLQQAQAETIMWSLDGALRFVPLAALHDGRQYLIERYRQVVFTPASNARWKDAPKPQWQAIAFGVTKPHEQFPALPAVAAELNGIVGPVLKGRALLDDAFTAATMREALRQRFPVVHVASHFRFEPGNKSASFLLLGDGAHLSLSEMERMENLFSGVDLLTLSACETGVGDVDPNGREVEGLGVLAQRQGAKAVVATLWPVADASTSRLMREFYRWRTTHPGTTKIEALQQAQLMLVHSTEDAASPDDRGLRESGPAHPRARLSHPYFWAPFFLMGNWL